MAAIAGVIIGSISLLLTLMVYAYGAWRRFRLPKFWVTYAHATAEPLSKTPTAAGPDLVQMGNVFVDVAYTGGGQPRNIIDTAFLMVESGTGMSSPVEQGAIPVPAELAGRFTLNFGGGLAVEANDEVPCVMRFDCGREYFDLPFTLRRVRDGYLYTPVEIWGEMFSLSTRRSKLGRLFRRRDTL